MKYTFLLFITVAMLYSCGSSDANKTTGKATVPQSEKQNLPPGAIATSGDGWSMAAKINGKDIAAHSMMIPEGNPQIVCFYDGDKYIELPYIPEDLVVGKKISFRRQNATLTTNDSVSVRSGNKGEMKITKVDGKWAEGKFFFTAYSYDGDKAKTVEVTDGFFRIANSQNK